MFPCKLSLAANLLAMSALLSAASATAQETMGEFLDKGAVPLVGDDLVRTLTSSAWRGLPNERVSLSFSADKTFSGSMQSSLSARNPGARGVFGEWSVREDGAVCLKFKSNPNDPAPACRFVYRLDAQNLVSTPSAERDAQITRLASSR